MNVSGPVRVGNTLYQISTEVRKVAEDVIEKEGLSIEPAQVEYLLVYPYVSKKVAGRCIRSGKELKFFSGHDYLIEMSGNVWSSLGQDAKYALTFHELLHIKVEVDKDGNVKYRIAGHDVQDFAQLINRLGINWIEALKTHMIETNELSADDAREIKL